MEQAGKWTFVGGFGLLVVAVLLASASPGAANVLAGVAWLAIVVGVILYAVGRKQARAERIKF